MEGGEMFGTIVFVIIMQNCDDELCLFKNYGILLQKDVPLLQLFKVSGAARSFLLLFSSQVFHES